MRFFCYGRKSVFSDKSDSVDNQLRMCLDYCESKFHGQIDSWECFSDEDFTGANTDRPQLQLMFSRIRENAADALVVYQLDRLSRNVRDFSNMYAMLEEHGVMFISIKETIDTTTPIGRAMMFVTAVFAQMERETIAERVSDNMLGLARKGYWTGGNPPVGYVRKSIVEHGRKHVTIIPDPDGVDYVNRIFDTFLSSNRSLQGMETQFKNSGIKTLSGKFFSSTQLYKILTMPFCVEATPEVYDYYANKGCIMDPDSPREKWDGSVGVMVYGRTTGKNKKHQLQPPEKWTVCLGHHEPFMKADKWLLVQSRFSEHKCIKDAKWPVPLMKGVLRCKCGSLMSVSRKKRVDGSCSSWYYCRKRMRQGVSYCDMGQTACDKLDSRLISIFRDIAADPKLINQYLQKTEDKPLRDPKAILSSITSCDSKIGRLTASLALAESSSISKYIIAEIKRLDSEKSRLQKELADIEHESKRKMAREKDSLKAIAEISRLMSGLDGFNDKERNEIVRSVVKTCTWDGVNLFITL